MPPNPYDRLATWYDTIYAAKDYAGEARIVEKIIRREGRSAGRSLLDVACGTGGHLVHLKEQFEVVGLDASAAMLRAARRKLPGVRFHRGDMRSFRLGRSYDAIVCLFSAVGYLTRVADLRAAFRTFAMHLNPGGVLIVEPFIRIDRFSADRPFMTIVDQPDLKIARVNVNRRRGNVAVFDMHYLIATPRAAKHRVERHEVRLAEPDRLVALARTANLRAEYLENGLQKERGLLVAVRPRES